MTSCRPPPSELPKAELVLNVKVRAWPVAAETTSVGVTVIVPAPSAAPAAIDVARKKRTNPTNPATGAPSARRLVLVLNM
jgi:hypothetical protein